MDLSPDIKICEKARYNVLSIKSKNNSVLKRWPELKLFPEFLQDFGTMKDVFLNTESVLRYCLLFYQKNTLNTIIPSYQQRKVQMAVWAGFELDKNKNQFPSRVEDMLLGKTPQVNKLIARVLQLSNDVLYQQMVVYESARHRYMLKLETGDEKNAKNLMEIIDRATDKIQEIQEKILKQDFNTPIKDELYHSVVVATLPTPEAIARAKKEGNIDDLIDAPYEIDHPTLKVGGTKKL
jgi:hypothetical protein